MVELKGFTVKARLREYIQILDRIMGLQQSEAKKYESNAGKDSVGFLQAMVRYKTTKEIHTALTKLVMKE